MNNESFKLALAQISSGETVQDNWRLCQKIFSDIEAQKEKVDLICFPENSLYLGIDAKVAMPEFHLEDDIFAELKDWSSRLNAMINLGSVPLSKKGKLFNSMVLADPSQGVESVYDKIHLFDVDVVGQNSIRESAKFAAGQAESILNFRSWKIGNSICYDMRFAELFLKYAKAQVDIILVPSAFLVPTGMAHWHSLLRARAIESQCYVAASAQVGPHTNAAGMVRNTFGHSLLIDPWGEVLVDLGKEKNTYAVVELKKEKIS